MKRKSVIDMDRLVLAIDNWGLALVNEMQLLREAIVAINIDRKDEQLGEDINVRSKYEPHPCKTCPYHEQCCQEDWRTCHWDYVSERYIEPQTERSE